jgi:hypothetical protein
MGFLSRLFGSSSGSHEEESSGSHGEESVFRIPWFSETGTGDCELQDAYVLLSDIEALTASDIAAIREKCKQAARPLVLVTPGVDRSVLPLLREGDTTAIKATPLPDQPLGGLLDDLVVIAGGRLLCRPLGLGLSFPESLSSLAEQGIVIPNLTWEQLSLDDLAAVDRLRITRDGVELCWVALPQGRKRYVQAYTATLLRGEPTPGRDERLRRLWTATGLLPDEAERAAMLLSESAAEYPFGLASPYFVTEPGNMECRLDDALVAVFGEPLCDLDLLVCVLGRVVRHGRPLLLLAPSVSDEVLAICVVNKLRGILPCAAAVPRSQSEVLAAMLAEIADRTGAKVVTRSDAHRSQEEGFLGRAMTVQVTCAGTSLTT